MESGFFSFSFSFILLIYIGISNCVNALHCFYIVQPRLTIMLSIVQCFWCPPLSIHFWNSTSSKGKLLIRCQSITISGDNKRCLLLCPPSLLLILIRNLLSIILCTEPIHHHHPAPTSPLQSSMSFSLWQREQGSETGEGRRDGKREIQEARAAFHFRCLAMQLCPASTVLANSAPSPWEAHLVHNLRPCNAVPGPQW